MKHTISVLVENHFGVLVKVAGLFSARGYNLDSLTVGETHDPSISRMTIVTHGDDRIIEQITKQLNRLVDVIKVADLHEGEMIDRELVLVKVEADLKTRPDIMQIVNTFRAKIVDVDQDSVTVEVTGNESKVDAMLELFLPFDILEVVRTGLIAMARGAASELAPARKKKAVTSKSTTKKASKKKAVKKKSKRTR